MKKIIGALMICLLFMAFQVPPTTSAASINQFAGRWENVNVQTSGTTRFEISTMAGKIYFHGYGRCHPRDCDMGEAEATAYAPNAGSDVFDTAQALTVVYDKDFADTTIIIQPINGTRLRVETFTHFKDGSKRSDYMSVENFTRSSR